MPTPMPADTLTKAKVQIPEDRYKADLELHDRYISFSSELLRLSIAGIAATGFMIATFAHNGQLPPVVGSPLFLRATLASLALLALSSACALAHRYLASDGMYFHLRAIKHLILIEEGQVVDEAAARANARAAADEKVRNRRFERSAWLLSASALLLFLGVVAAGASFTVMLVMAKP